MGIQVCSNEGPRPFPRGDNNEIAEIDDKIEKKNLLFQNHWANFNHTWHKHPLVKEIQGLANNDHSLIKKEMIGFFFFSKSMLRYDNSFEQMCLFI